MKPTNNLHPSDKEILSILQVDGSLTYKEIAFKTRKSVATVNERIRRLKEQGIIKAIVAVLDRKQIDKNVIAYCQVVLSDHANNTLGQFTEAVAKFPEVMECFQMTGNCDYLLKIAVRDVEDYSNFYNTNLAKLPNITTVQTSFVLTEIKNITAYPLT